MAAATVTIILIFRDQTLVGEVIALLRADVKDLIFPGNLQEIMNKVLAAERMSQAQLVEARTKADTQIIEARAKSETQKLQVQTQAEAQKLMAQAESEVSKIKTESEIATLRQQEQAAQAYANHPALLRLRELETMSDLGKNANAHIYLGMQKHANLELANGKED